MYFLSTKVPFLFKFLEDAIFTTICGFIKSLKGGVIMSIKRIDDLIITIVVILIITGIKMIYVKETRAQIAIVIKSYFKLYHNWYIIKKVK